MFCLAAYCRRACDRILIVVLLTCFLSFVASQSSEPVENAGFITCDFDLPNLAAIVPHLPQPCQTIYYDVQRDQNSNALYQLYEQEAKAFDDFARKLNAHEWPTGSEKPTFDSALRTAIYNDDSLPKCVSSSDGNNNNNSVEDFLRCQRERNTQLMNAVPQ